MGVYNRHHIWNSQDLKDGTSYLWHKKYSYHHTEYFGRFACRVCSKILGIGAAERSWGDTKHIQNSKRSSLAPERLSKLTTIYGSNCVERAKVERMAKVPTQITDEAEGEPSSFFWTNDDFDEAICLSETNDNEVGQQAASKKGVRMVNCWIEPWEQEAIETPGDISEAKLLKKYSGLMWYGGAIDKCLHTADSQNMKWCGNPRKRGGGGEGWKLKSRREGWDKCDPNDWDMYEDIWPLHNGCLLHERLLEYYEAGKHENIMAVKILGPIADNV